MERLSHEKQYLKEAQTNNEIELRKVWIAQIEKELDQEVKLLGSKGVHIDLNPCLEMTVDELAAELAV